MTEKLPDTPADDKKIRISVPDLAVGAMAAVLVAMLGSRLGTAGTLAGAASASVASALANTFLSAGFERTREGLKLVVTRRRGLLEADDADTFDTDEAGHEVSIASAQPRAANGRFMRVVQSAGWQDDSGLPADRFLDREISWLQFNERVLQMAADESVPLLERARFLAIFTSNLDEFFMVRVAGLKRRIVTGLAVPTNVGRSPA